MSASDTVVLEEEIDPNYVPTESEVVEYAKWLGMDLEKDTDLFWIAREGLMAPLPADWKPCKTKDTEDIYYFNFKTGESTWDHPCDGHYKSMYENHKKKKEIQIKDKNDSKKSRAKQDVAELIGKKDKKDRKKDGGLASLGLGKGSKTMPAIGDPGSGSATVRTLGALNNGGGSDSDGGIAPLVNNLNKPVLSGLGKKALPGISTLGPIDGPKASSIEPSLSLEPNKDINNLKDKSSVSSNRSSVSSSTSSRVSKLKSVISDSGEFSASPVPTSNTSRLPQTDSEEKRKKKHRKSREESKEEDDRGSNRPKTSRHYATDSDDDTVDSRETRSNRKSKPQTHSKSQRAAEEEEKIRSANRKHNSQSPGVESPVNESGSKTRSRSSSGAQPIKNQKQQVHRETPTKSKHKSSSKYPKPKSKSAFDMTTPLSPPNEEDELVEDDDAIQSFDVNDFDVSPSSDEKHDKRGQSHSNSNREREMRRKEEDDILYTNTSSSGHKNQEGTVNKKLYGGRDKDDSSAWFTSSEEEEEDSHLFRKYNYSGDGESKEGSDSDSSHRRRQRELEKSVPSGIAGSVRFMSGTGETEVGAGFDDDDEPNKSGFGGSQPRSSSASNSELGAVKRSLQLRTQELSNVEEELLEVKRDFAELQRELTDKNKQITQLKQSLSEAEDALDKVKNGSDSKSVQDDLCVDLKLQITSAKLQITELNEAKTVMKQQHEEACSEMARVHDKKLKELEADWKAQIDKTVAELENTHKAKCATLEEEFNVKYQLLVDKYDSVSNDHKSTSKQLSLVNSTLTTYNDKIAKLNSENSQLQEQIQLMTKTISMLNTGPTTTSEASLDAEKGGGVDAKIAALQTELDSVKSEWVATQQQLTDVTGSRMEADRLNAELSAQLKTLQSEVDTLQEANTELTEKQLASKKQHENEIEKLVSTYNASQAVLKKQLSDSVNEKNNMLKQSSKKEMELKRAKEELNNSATSIDTLRLAEQTNSQLEQELVQLKTETAERNQDYEARMEKLRLEVLEKAGEVDKLRLELNVLQSKADDATSVAPITETVSTVQHNALRKELEVAQDKIRLQETSAAGVTAQLESVQSQLQKEMTSNAQASEELRELKETNLALRENIKSITAGVSVPAKAEQSSSSIDVTVHESEIAHLKANFESKLKLIQQELQNSSELHDMKDASISKYQCDALQLHGQILEKANAVSELMQEVNRLKAEIAVSTPVAVATDKCFSALECSNKIHEVEMQYTEKLHANEKQIANLSLELSTAENKVRSLARERDILESTVKQLNEKLLVDENVINSVNTNALTVSENQKVELDRAYEKIYALENEVKGLQSEISRQDANLMLQGESNKRVVDTLEARVMELNQELHVFKEKEKIMRVAETDVDKDNGNADALVKRLQCLMEDMSAKQTQQFQLLFETTKASRANISEDAKTENNKKCVGVKDKKSLEQEMKHADVESLVTPGSHLNLPAEGGDIEIMASSPDSMLEGEVSSTDVSYSESNSDSVSSTPASALEAEVLSTPRPGKSGAFSRLARGLQTPITPLCVEGAGFATPSLADMAKMEYHQLLSLIADYKADVHQRKVQLRKKKGMLLVKQKKLEKQRKSWKASKAALGQLQMKYDAIHKQLKRKQKAGHGRGQVKLDVELLSEMQSDMAKKQKRLQQSSTLLNAEAQVLNQEVGGLRDSNASIVEQEHKIEKFERLAAKLRQQKRDSKLQPGSNFNNQKRVPMDDSLLDDHKALHSLLDGLNAFASPGVRGAASDSDSTNITDMFFQFDAVGGGKKKDRDSASNPSPTPHPPPTPPPQMAYPHHLFHPAAHYYYPGVPHPGPMGLPAGYYGRQDQVPVPLQYYPPPYWNPAAQPQPEGNFKLQSSVDHSTQNRAPSGPALSTLYDQYKSNDMHAQAIHNKQGTVQLQQYLKQRNASSSLCDNHTSWLYGLQKEVTNFSHRSAKSNGDVFKYQRPSSSQSQTYAGSTSRSVYPTTGFESKPAVEKVRENENEPPSSSATEGVAL